MATSELYPPLTFSAKQISVSLRASNLNGYYLPPDIVLPNSTAAGRGPVVSMVFLVSNFESCYVERLVRLVCDQIVLDQKFDHPNTRPWFLVRAFQGERDRRFGLPLTFIVNDDFEFYPVTSFTMTDSDLSVLPETLLTRSHSIAWTEFSTIDRCVVEAAILAFLTQERLCV